MQNWIEELQKQYDKKPFYVNLEALGIVESIQKESSEECIMRIENRIGRKLTFEEKIAITTLEDFRKFLRNW